ncbi:glycoside hydrolase family 15 [Candidatus Woesearchaeota archaeon]|nr:glycoside hydrolase family 15 [Candidatus Woesearchaeota archaeon]
MIQYPNGLFAAANSQKTGYHRVWIRDNIYTLLGHEAIGSWQVAEKTIHALLDILKKHEYKIDWMIKQPHPKDKWRYIHPRYEPDGKEIWEEWGNKQNDAMGALLWKIGDLHNKKKLKLRKGDKEIIQKLVDYLQAIEYWHDADNGMWEENEEVHASSVGACLAGLLAVQDIVNVPLHMIAHGEQALRTLLPKESVTKDVDLALLSLIYPYNIVTPKEREAILRNVEQHLIREKGVIRYVGDKYYNNGKEAEWTLGLPWLATIYKQLKQPAKHYHYLNKTKNAANSQGELPELYYGGTSEHNENTPLAWAMSLWRVANGY